MIIDKGAVFIAPVGSKDPKDWKPLGEVHQFEVIESAEDSEQDKRWQEMLSTARQITSFSTTLTFTLKTTPALQHRNTLRLFGFQPSSLIHNGRKRRK